MPNINEISSNSNIDREKALDSIFSNVPSEATVVVDLPSKGKAYSNYTGVRVTPLTFKDEYNILVARNSEADPINSIIESCTKGVNPNELLLFDKLYLLMKIREVSYGPEYEFETICPSCKKTVETKIDITKLPVEEVPDEFSDVLEVMLPVTKVKAVVRYRRSSDEMFMDNPEDPVSLRRVVLEINGIQDELVISKALAKMHIRDIKTLIKAIDTDKFGIQSKFRFECPHCKHNAVMGVPLTSNFFSVT